MAAARPVRRSAPADTLDWRSFFPAPRLQALIATALDYNRDMRIAVARIEEALYKAGISSYLEVLDAQRESYAAQQGTLRRAWLSAAAQLYKSLGGGSL